MKLNTNHQNDITDNTGKKQTPKEKTNVVKIESRGAIDYNVDEIDSFIDHVFHSQLDPDEHIIGWVQKTNTPAYPKDIDKIITKFGDNKPSRVCYFGTATVTKDGDGELFNRKKQFKRLHVVVLDDIGTKIPLSKVPEDLIPNYIIESSEGNFQYGFILETPIHNYDLAEALIHLVYTSGFSDTGGKLPCKPVRLPCGINGKEGAKGDFKVRLTAMNTDYWTPNDLLDILDVGVTWADVEADIGTAKQGKSARFTGTSLWSPIKATAASLAGVIDPVLEWLYEQDLVIDDSGDWVKVKCPWLEGHTSGDGSAGYSPIGRGGNSSNCRGFKCFHDHCSEFNTTDFLKHVAGESGIEAPVIDNVADLVADYAYSISDNAAIRIRGVNKPAVVKIEGFKNAHPKKVAVYDFKGKDKLVCESALWLTSPNRVTVQGLKHDPSSREKVIKYDGLKYINTYAEPQWGKGKSDEKDVGMFKHFLEYLIPYDEERDYFTQWLAAKAQDPTFKGAGILMVAPAQGTGRTTLTDMITSLFTPENVNKVSFQQLCGAMNSGAFNDWLEAGIVTCDEIISNGQSKYKVYETLKDLLDPRPKNMVINAKYGAQRSTTLYTSYLLLTNHVDAIGAMGDDRRMYVIQNTLSPASADYFERLNAWIDIKGNDGQPAWARSVWRWLHTLTPDLLMLNSPAPSTRAKEVMIDETKSRPDVAAEVLMEYFEGAIPMKLIDNMARDLMDRNDPTDIVTKAAVVTSIIKNKTQAAEVRVTINNSRVRLRVSNNLLKDHGIKKFGESQRVKFHDILVKIADRFKDDYENDYENLITKLNDRIDDLLA